MKLKFTYKVKVFYMPGPVLGEGVTCTALATQADLLPPFKVIRDYDYEVIPHNHISYSDWWYSTVTDPFGWVIDGENFKTLVYYCRIMYTYSKGRGFRIHYLPKIFIPWASRIYTHGLFVWSGALNITREYTEGTIIYGFGGGEMMGGLTLYRAQPPMVIETSLVKELLEKLLNRKRYLDSFLLKRFQYYKYWKLSSLQLISKDIKEIINLITDTNMDRGYIISEDIFEYPVVSDFCHKFISKEDWTKLKDPSKGKVFSCLIDILLLEMFKISMDCSRILSRYEENILDSWYYDLLYTKSQFKILSEWCHKYLSNTLKRHLIFKGVSVTKEHLAGFDTEYVPLDFGKNRLLSAQLSISALVKMHIPVWKDFDFEGTNTLSEDIFDKSPPSFSDVDFAREWIRRSIKDTREIMHGKVDNDMRKMIKHFEKHSLIDNISTNDSGVNFLFKKRPIKNIIFFAEGKEQLTLNMGTIVKYIYDSYNLDHDVSRLYKEILNINYTQDTVSFKNVYKRTLPWNSKTFEEQPLLNTVYLSNSVNDSLRSFKVDSTTTKYYIDLWNNNTKIKINVTQSMFLYAHYNAADFSLIEDWEKIRFRNVDILKKSFCSLRIPLKNFGISLYLRDTVLLASASAGSLDSLAKAHGLAKVPVPGYFIKGRMDELLKINRKLFTEYAINDSRITLIHALFMNDFSFSLGSIKNPSTLGSISTRYIKNKWVLDSYRGYQINTNYPLGNAQVSHTPKGLRSLGFAGETLNLFLSSFRGGRNECFAYGKDEKTLWHDYDLSSCYATIMSMCGNGALENAVDPGTVKEGGELPLGLPPLFSPNPSKEGDSEEPRAPLPPPGGPEGKATSPTGKNSGRRAPGEEACLPCVRHDEVRGVKPLEEVALNDSLRAYDGCSLSEGEGGSEVRASDFDVKLPEEVSENEKLSNLFPSVSSLCGQPDYSKGRFITTTNHDFIDSYSAVRVSWNFPSSILYPPLPLNIDDNITIYPLKGEGIVTGLEFQSAKNILQLQLYKMSKTEFIKLEDLYKKYYVRISYGSVIPFKKNSKNELIEKPFFSVINDLQRNRRQHPKKSAMERMYKDLGNMLYGKVVCGISNKRSFDSRYEVMKAMEGGFLTNPMIGTWITGFVRALIAELLYFNRCLGGKTTSVTTDGFTSNIENLEEKVVKLMKERGFYEKSLLSRYKNIREILSRDPNALEVKISVKGLIQWTTRGQMSLKPGIGAMTGFQKHLFTQEEILKALIPVLGKGNKLVFLQNRLSGALDNYQNDMQVSMITSLRVFRTVFDSKRLIILGPKNEMLYTTPYVKADKAVLHRILLNRFRTSVYSSEFTDKNTFVTSQNVDQEVLLYFIRIVCEYYKWHPSVDHIYNVWWTLKQVWPKIKIEKVFDIFNRILMKKGVIMNKLNIYKRTIVIVQILYKYLTDKESLSLLKDYRFIILFTERFSNVLNINPAHTALVLVPPREMIIYSKYSPFDNEYFVKYYVNKILTTMNMSIFIPDFLRTKVLNEVKKVLFKNVPEKYVSIILKNISKAKENIVVKPRSVPVPVPVPLVSVPTTETVTEPVNITGSLSVICISPIILILPSIEEEETKEEFLTGTLEFINILKPKPKPKVQKEVNEFFFFSG